MNGVFRFIGTNVYTVVECTSQCCVVYPVSSHSWILWRSPRECGLCGIIWVSRKLKVGWWPHSCNNSGKYINRLVLILYMHVNTHPLLLTVKKELSKQLTVCYFRFRWVNTIHYHVEENYMTIFSSFSANFTPHCHTKIGKDVDGGKERTCVSHFVWLDACAYLRKNCVLARMIVFCWTAHHDSGTNPLRVTGG